MRTYTFIQFDGVVGNHMVYVESFLRDMNAHRFIRHNNPQLANYTPDNMESLNRTRLAYGHAPLYNDGRVTPIHGGYVYGIVHADMPPNAVALVYLTTRDTPIGYLVVNS